MYKRFSEFKEQRETQAFVDQFNQICEGIASSGLSFEAYWAESALPTLLESNSLANDEELMLEFMGRMKGLFNRMMGRQQAPAKPAAPQMSPEQQQKVDRYQQQADKMVDQIKQRFTVSMRDFLKAVTDDAKTQGNPHMWKVAQSFYQKIMSTAQPVMDQFKMKAKIGKADYKDQFNRERGSMQQNQQAAMKQRLMSQPGAQQHLDKARVAQGGMSSNELMQQAKDLVSRNPGFTVDQLVTPDGKPTEMGKQYLMPPDEWRKKMQGVTQQMPQQAPQPQQAVA